jgi:hypothetical protein
MSHCLPDGDEMRGLGTIHPHHEYHHSVKQPECPQALLAIVFPGVLRCHRRPIENHSTMSEIYAVLPQIHLTLGLGPGEHSENCSYEIVSRQATERAHSLSASSSPPRARSTGPDISSSGRSSPFQAALREKPWTPGNSRWRSSARRSMTERPDQDGSGRKPWRVFGKFGLDAHPRPGINAGARHDAG